MLYAFAKHFIVSKELEERLFLIYEDAEARQRNSSQHCQKKSASAAISLRTSP